MLRKLLLGVMIVALLSSFPLTKREALAQGGPPGTTIWPTYLHFTQSSLTGEPKQEEYTVYVNVAPEYVRQYWGTIIDEPWIDCAPREGDHSMGIHVSLQNTSSFSPGVYTGTITLIVYEEDGPNREYPLRIKLTVRDSHNVYLPVTLRQSTSSLTRTGPEPKFNHGLH